MPDDNGFAERLREIRRSRGRYWTQMRVAVAVGVERSTYQSWERSGNSHRPRPAHERKLAKVLGVQLHHLHEPAGTPIPHKPDNGRKPPK